MAMIPKTASAMPAVGFHGGLRLVGIGLLIAALVAFVAPVVGEIAGA